MKEDPNKSLQTFHGFNDLIIYFSTITKLITFTNVPNAKQIKFTWITLRLKVNVIELWFRSENRKFVPNQIVRESSIYCGFSLLSINFPKYSIWTINRKKSYSVGVCFLQWLSWYKHLTFVVSYKFCYQDEQKFSENLLKLKARRK